MAASNVITTSLVINFENPNSQASAHLSAEIDSRADGYNKGNTQFFFGDSPAFLVYKTDNVSTTMYQTDGGIAGLGSVVITVKDYLQFTNTNSASLSKPPYGGVSYTYLGGTGSLSLTTNGVNVQASANGIALYRADYSTLAQAYRISGCTKEAVMIFIDGIVNS